MDIDKILLIGNSAYRTDSSTIPQLILVPLSLCKTKQVYAGFQHVHLRLNTVYKQSGKALASDSRGAKSP